MQRKWKLETLSLSDNKMSAGGITAIAEALHDTSLRNLE